MYDWPDLWVSFNLRSLSGNWWLEFELQKPNNKKKNNIYITSRK